MRQELIPGRRLDTHAAASLLNSFAAADLRDPDLALDLAAALMAPGNFSRTGGGGGGGGNASPQDLANAANGLARLRAAAPAGFYRWLAAQCGAIEPSRFRVEEITSLWTAALSLDARERRPQHQASDHVPPPAADLVPPAAALADLQRHMAAAALAVPAEAWAPRGLVAVMSAAARSLAAARGARSPAGASAALLESRQADGAGRARLARSKARDSKKWERREEQDLVQGGWDLVKWGRDRKQWERQTRAELGRGGGGIRPEKSRTL